MISAAAIVWRPLQGFPEATAAQDRLQDVLRGWEGTPYRAGAQAKGRDGGVDCVRFVCGVLDELYGERRSAIQTSDVSTNIKGRK